jgi:hypothetical protein
LAGAGELAGPEKDVGREPEYGLPYVSDAVSRTLKAVPAVCGPRPVGLVNERALAAALFTTKLPVVPLINRFDPSFTVRVVV